MSEAQVKELLLQVEMLKKRKCPELGVVMHVVLAGVRMGKCVASMYFVWKGEVYVLLALSGWATRSVAFTETFITPNNTEAI
jgi:hypothetical protein